MSFLSLSLLLFGCGSDEQVDVVALEGSQDAANDEEGDGEEDEDVVAEPDDVVTLSDLGEGNEEESDPDGPTEPSDGPTVEAVVDTWVDLVEGLWAQYDVTADEGVTAAAPADVDGPSFSSEIEGIRTIDFDSELCPFDTPDGFELNSFTLDFESLRCIYRNGDNSLVASITTLSGETFDQSARAAQYQDAFGADVVLDDTGFWYRYDGMKVGARTIDGADLIRFYTTDPSFIEAPIDGFDLYGYVTSQVDGAPW